MKRRLVSALMILLFSVALLLWIPPGIYAVVVAIIQRDQTEFPSTDSVELSNLVQINWESAVLYDSDGKKHFLGENHEFSKDISYLSLTTVEKANRGYVSSAESGIYRISFDTQQNSEGSSSFCTLWLFSNTCVLLEIVESMPDNRSRYREYWYEFREPALVRSLLPDAVQPSLNSTVVGFCDKTIQGHWAES